MPKNATVVLLIPVVECAGSSDAMHRFRHNEFLVALALLSKVFPYRVREFGKFAWKVEWMKAAVHASQFTFKFTDSGRMPNDGRMLSKICVCVGLQVASCRQISIPSISKFWLETSCEAYNTLDAYRDNDS